MKADKVKKRIAKVTVIVLLLAVIVCLLSSCGKEKETVKEYIEIPDLVGESIGKAKEVLSEKDVVFEVIQDDDAARGKVSRLEFSGISENGILNIEKGSVVKIYANEKGLNGKTVYLTVDDGPTRDNTLKILDTLDRYAIKATFFLQGQNIEKEACKGLTEEIYKRGHLIGCHSYSHDISEIYSSPDKMISEIRHYEDAMRSVFGEEAFENMPKLFRFPGGSVQNGKISREESKEYISEIEDMGYRIYDWSFLIADGELRRWDKASETEEEYNAYVSEFMRSNFETSLAQAEKSGGPLILLVHDKWTATDNGITVDGKQFWDWMIELLIEKGYTFDTLDSIPSYLF